jgi:DNA-binding Lrp family transcriptional regulator
MWTLRNRAVRLPSGSSTSRCSFSTLVSDQTIARRYRKLRSSGVLRVVGIPEAAPLGQAHWLVRLRCVPDAAAAIAAALARRDDTHWVSLMSGGTEIVCFVRAPLREETDGLLLGQLPRTPRVVSMTAYRLLRRFAGGPAGWPGRANALSASQVSSLRRTPVLALYRPEPGDLALLAALAHDGRADISTLAAACGRSESTVRRRLAALRSSGALYFDVDVDAALLGYPLTATLWLTVAPSALESTGQALARHPQVAFAAATTGPANLVANVGCRDDAALYAYLADDLGGLEGVHQVETAPMIRTLKRFGTLQVV